MTFADPKLAEQIEKVKFQAYGSPLSQEKLEELRESKGTRREMQRIWWHCASRSPAHPSMRRLLQASGSGGRRVDGKTVGFQ
mmetsp:Transcript_15888/g.27015  ORF Transcript_15888/g.27015 Transcript_15888/m.27015 type:complete len:82 (+) Transcript_15888:513-758(+)